MKNPANYILCFFFLMFFAAISLKAQTNPDYNRSLADSLGADQYGMKNYVFVILKTGSVKISDKTKLDSLFKGHIANIGRLASAGKLTVAGPFQANPQNYRGLFILNVKTVEEARQLLETDPAIKTGIFDTELFGWYGSAALPMYLPYHQKVTKEKL